MRRTAVVGSVVAVAALILPLVMAPLAPAGAVANIELCSASSALSVRPFATAADYSVIRGKIADPANFGPTGIVPRSVNLRAGMSTIDTTTLAGCEVILFSELFSAPSPASLAAIDAAVLGGARLIVDSDSAGIGVAALDAILASFGGGRGANSDGICPNGTRPVSNIDDIATNGPFGDLRGGTFGTSIASTVIPAATDHVVVLSPQNMRMVIPPGSLGTGSGVVMAGSDVSAHNIFAANVNHLMYMNVIAGAAVALAADLGATKSCPANAVPGDSYTCTVTVTNSGPNAATGVVVNDDLAAGTSLVGTPTATNGFTCGTGDPFTCNGATLANGQSTVITYTVVVADTVGPATALTNNVTVTSATADPTTPNTASATTNTPTCTIDRRTATSPQSIVGTNGNDVICGSPYGDSITALAGNDTIFGLGGNDSIQGGEGNDRIFGGDGDDTITGPPGTDAANGGAGYDRCTAQTNTNCEASRVA
jgi:uncharacterized repeat protein (TIGR01451 family)